MTVGLNQCGRIVSMMVLALIICFGGVSVSAVQGVELYLSDPEISPAEPHQGDEATIVLNFDIDHLDHEAKVHMYIFVDNIEIKHAYNYFSAGASSYEFKYNTGGLSVGEHSLRAMVKVYDRNKANYVIEESSRMFVVDKPTFHIDIDEVEVTPVDAELKDTVRFRMKLDIEGESDDNEVRMELLVNNITRKKPVTSFDEGEHIYVISYYLDPQYIHQEYNNFKILVYLYDKEGNLKDYDTNLKRIRVEGDFEPEIPEDEAEDETIDEIVFERPSISVNHYPRSVGPGEKVKIYGYVSDSRLDSYAHLYLDGSLITPLELRGDGYYETYLTISDTGSHGIAIVYKNSRAIDNVYIGSEVDEGAVVLPDDAFLPYKITIIDVDNVRADYIYDKEFIDVHASQKEIDINGERGNILRIAVTSHMKGAVRVYLETSFDEAFIFLPDSEIVKPGERKYLDVYFAPSIDFGNYEGFIHVMSDEGVVAELPVRLFVMRTDRDSSALSTELFDSNISLTYILGLLLIFAFIIITSVVKEERKHERKPDVRAVAKLRDAVTKDAPSGLVKHDKKTVDGESDAFIVNKKNVVD